MQLLSNLNLNDNQLLNTVLQNLAVEPSSPRKGKIYFDTNENVIKIYNGTIWSTVGKDGVSVEVAAALATINDGLALKAEKTYVDTELAKKETPAQAQVKATKALDDAKIYVDDRVKTPVPLNALFSDTVVTKTGLGMGDVDNTSDLAKPVSTAQQAALSLKEDKTVVSAKVATAESNANTYTDNKIGALVGAGTTEALDTLKELAEALGNDPNFATTILNALKLKSEVYSSPIGNGSATSITVTHNLNSRDVIAQLRQTGTPFAVAYPDIEMTTVNTLTLKFAEAPTPNEYTIIVTGKKG